MSRAVIWKQNRKKTETNVGQIFLPNKILDGPKDHQIEIVGVNAVKGDSNGDFVIDPMTDTEAFDAIHVFAVIRQIMTMYQRSLFRIGREKPLNWQWSANEPIKIYPRAGNQPKAYYSRQGQCIKFFSFNRNGKTVYTSRSYDVVGHECGHAILDSLRTGYWASWQPETGALHESFADITIILGLLSQQDQCQSIIFHSRGDLHKKTFFTHFSADLGEALGGGRRGLRSADNDFTLSDVSFEVHDISQVFTGAFYDILADIFYEHRKPDLRDDADTLFRVGEHMTDLLVEALIRSPPQNATFKDVAERMVSLEKNTRLKATIKYHFTRREILGKNRVRAPTKPVEIKWGKCHCCMSRKEHLNAVEDAIRIGQRCLPFQPKLR